MFKNTQSYSQKVIYKIGFIDIFTEPIFKIMSCSAPLKSSGEKGFQKEKDIAKVKKKREEADRADSQFKSQRLLELQKRTNSSGEAVIL